MNPHQRGVSPNLTNGSKALYKLTKWPQAVLPVAVSAKLHDLEQEGKARHKQFAYPEALVGQVSRYDD